ncbi:MAG TPA: threonine synthase, partial [Caulobacteraceae bacterium]|nr:threonine synthase [Caulobacteraceae bacterium]
ALFRGAAVSEAETSRTILSTLNETGELVDTHTAVALAAARRLGSPHPTTPLVVLSTAHAAKFPDEVLAATGVAPTAPAAARGLAEREERFDHLPADAAAVKAYVREFVAA